MALSWIRLHSCGGGAGSGGSGSGGGSGGGGGGGGGDRGSGDGGGGEGDGDGSGAVGGGGEGGGSWPVKMQSPQLRAHCALMRGIVHEPAACFLAQKPSLLADASAQGCIGAGGRGGGGIGPSYRPPVKLLVSKLLGLTSTVLASTAVMETTTPAKTAQQVNILRQHEHEELVDSGGSSSASTTTCWYRRGWPSLPIGRLVPLSSNSPSVSGALRIRMCGGVQTSHSESGRRGGRVPAPKRG